MTRPEPYEAYRDGGTPWLGEIPKHWSAGRLLTVARAWTSNVDKHTVDGDQPVRLCNYTDVYKNDDIVEGMTFMKATATPDQIARFRLSVGDTLLTKDSETADDIGVPAFVRYEAADLVCGYHLAIVRPDPGVAPRWLFWALASNATLRQWAVLAAGVTRVGIRRNDLARATLALPPSAEQHAIADYLDRETAQIDTLIGKQGRLVEALRERRAAVVERALMELAWTTPLRSVVRLIQTGPFGSQLKSDEYVEGGVPVINPSHMAGGQVVPDPKIAVSEAKALELARHELLEGDLVAARRGELGRCAVVAAESTGALCGTGSALVRPKGERIDVHFLALIFGSRATRDSLSLASVGSTMDNLNAGIIASLRIPVPPLDEQRDLLGHLDEQTAKIDALIAKAERFIEVSKERRSALITAAVTGQIDVRQNVGSTRAQVLVR